MSPRKAALQDVLERPARLGGYPPSLAGMEFATESFPLFVTIIDIYAVILNYYCFLIIL
jgi:hypothetical protein